MRNMLLGSLAGLAVGILGTFAYTSYLGDGQKLVQVQGDLASATTNLTQATQGSEKLKSEADNLSAEVQKLTSSNNELKHQLDDLKKSGSETAAPNPMAGFIKAALAQRYKQKLLLLKSRLNLTPQQEVALQAAMDEESKMAEEMGTKMFQGGKIDPQAIRNAFNDPNRTKGVDKTLNEILTPEQKTTYQQIQDDEKKSTAETMATYQMNQLAPALQLSETQKDQVYAALYQAQINPQTSPGSNPSNPASYLENQAKAKEDALAKILTPEQMTTYRQQSQSQLDMQKAMMQRFAPSSGASAAPAPAPAP